jgi:elongation factor 1-beta
MGQVAITFEIMPEGIEVDLSEIKDTIQSGIGDMCEIQNTEEKPIAFGLKALLMTVIVEDEEGIMDKLEETIGSVPGVQNAKVTSLSKL